MNVWNSSPKDPSFAVRGTTGNSNVSSSVTIHTNPTRRLVFWLIFKGAREESVLAVELYLVNLLKSLTIGLRNRKNELEIRNRNIPFVAYRETGWVIDG
jgi:hypothetical protein